MNERRVGGTDIASIVGVNPYGGPIEAYRRIAEGFKPEKNEAMERGILMEPVVRAMYLSRTGAKLKPIEKYQRSAKYAFMSASFDDIAIRDGAERVAEYKTANIRQAPYWGDAEDAVPASYLVQCAWYLAFTELPLADLSVLIAGDDFRPYTLKRDLELEAMLLEAGERFWIDHIKAGLPPAPDATNGYAEWLEARHPVNRGTVVPATAEAETWARKLAEARAMSDIADSIEREARNHLLSMIGDADGIEGEGWRVTWKQAKGRPSTDWRALCSVAGVPPELVEKYTARTPYRVFRPSGPMFKEKADNE